MSDLLVLLGVTAATASFMAVGTALRRALDAREAKRLPMLAKKMEQDLTAAPVAHDARLTPGLAGYREADRSHELEQALAAEYEAAVQRDKTRDFARSKWGLRLAAGVVWTLFFACGACLLWSVAELFAAIGVSYLTQALIYAFVATTGTAAAIRKRRREKQTPLRVAVAETEAVPATGQRLRIAAEPLAEPLNEPLNEPVDADEPVPAKRRAQ